ncbi:Uncharacterised protein [Bordetella pertussis]|nr:Uncharacterised protein [Bordetella pertussis]
MVSSRRNAPLTPMAGGRSGRAGVVVVAAALLLHGVIGQSADQGQRQAGHLLARGPA